MRSPSLKLVFCLFALLASSATAQAGDANRLSYLDDFCDPYYVGRDFPQLVTPQWIGEEGVEATVVLAIDDMRGHERWEAYLRPILKRLKKIDGRAPVSIMTNQIDPEDPHLQKWLSEGVTIEVHTADHPCPCLQGGDFIKAQSTYERCVDQMATIANNRPVAFRMPCCDSLNTPSPRFFTEIFNKTTAAGNFLTIDSSVFNVITPADKSLPRDLVLEDGKPRFRKYIPFPSFVNVIEDYPYPYVIGRLGWQFPCAVPSDWEAQNLQQPNNPRTVRDMQLAIDATVIKQGTFDLVFHPYGWIRNDQVNELIDHAVTKYGSKVKFLNFRECFDRLNKNLLAGQPLRAANGQDNGVRLVDVNDDGFLDVLIGNEQKQLTRIWSPDDRRWIETSLPVQLVDVNASGQRTEAGIRFGVVKGFGSAVMIQIGRQQSGVWKFSDNRWIAAPELLRGLTIDSKPLLTADKQHDTGVRLRDINGDGSCEVLVSNPSQNALFVWNAATNSWQQHSAQMPEGAMFVDAQGRDAGLRMVDVNGDGHDDVLFSNEERYSLHLYDSFETTWDRLVKKGPRRDGRALPMIVRGGTNNGAWFANKHLWVQNEDTSRLPDLVQRESFDAMLGDLPKGAKSPQDALKSMHVRPGFEIELVAAEPLVKDPIHIAWGPDAKLWVVEMADYPLGIDGKGKPGGRVRFLEDTNGDGKYDKSTLFLDGLGFPSSVAPWREGVLITAAPDVIYAEDTNGDGKADRREVVFHGFGEGNQQHRVNGLRVGLDNWLYLANGHSGGTIKSIKTGKKMSMSGRDLRIEPDKGLMENVSGQTQYARVRNDWGDWFGNDNSSPIWQYAFDEKYLWRNRHVTIPTSVRQIAKIPGAAPVYPASETIARFNDFHRADRFTSVCGPTFYRDELFGGVFRGNYFLCEPVHNLVSRLVVEPHGNTFVAQRAEDEASSEFLASDDNWFRPTTVRTGPDGALWIADMYRHVIEHPEWIPEDWQKRLDVRAGHKQGRIYRVYPKGKRPALMKPLDGLDTASLVAALDSPNGTRRDLVQQMLIWRGDEKAVAPLEKMAQDAARDLTRLHALCTLDGLGALSAATVQIALQDHSAGVRRHAVRLAESLVAKNERLDDRLVAMVTDPDDRVQMQLAYSLGYCKSEGVGRAIAKLALAHADDRFFTAAVLSSVSQDNVATMLSEVLQADQADSDVEQLVGQLVKMATKMNAKDAAIQALAAVINRQESTTDLANWRSALIILEAVQSPDADLLKTANAATKQQLEQMFGQARAAVVDADSDAERRIVAARLLGQRAAQSVAVREILTALLVPQNGPALQQAAVTSLVAAATDDVAERLLADWRSHTPTVRSQILDALLSRRVWRESLVDQLESGSVLPAHVDARRRQQLVGGSSTALRRRVMKIFTSESTDTRAAVLAAHQGVLSLTADAAFGKVLFAKHCAACHRLENVGQVVGPDLTALTNRSPEAMLTALLDPNQAVEDKFLDYAVITTDGRSLSGMLISETGTSITLAGQEGKQVLLPRSAVDEMQSTGKSLMPEGLEKDLKPQDLADLIGYVGAQRAPVRNEPKVTRSQADGSFYLAASDCIIYGTSVVFEPKYGNLGFWQSPEDRAVWELVVPSAGKYHIELDYACPDDTAGNRLISRIDYQVLKSTVKPTGSWDNYRWQSIGIVPIRQGPTQLVVRSDGPISGFLFDLRGVRITPVTK